MLMRHYYVMGNYPEGDVRRDISKESVLVICDDEDTANIELNRLNEQRYTGLRIEEIIHKEVN